MLGDGGAGVLPVGFGGVLGSPDAPAFRRPGVFAATTAAMRLIRARTPRKTRAVLRRLVLAGASLAGSIGSPRGASPAHDGRDRGPIGTPAFVPASQPRQRGERRVRPGCGTAGAGRT